jgi:hypothetical protein
VSSHSTQATTEIMPSAISTEIKMEKKEVEIQPEEKV